MAMQILSPLDKSYRITTSFLALIGYGPEAGRRHDALDYGTPRGTNIYAVTNGTIARADAKDPAGGKIITLRSVLDGQNFEAVYAHLDKMYVQPGQQVKAGDIIGTTGSSGIVTGAHLHFETKLNGTPVDPQKLINGLINPKDVGGTILASSKGGTSTILTWLTSYFKDHSNDVGSRTWGDFFSTPNPAFIGAPWGSGFQPRDALTQNGLWDKTISVTDFPKVAAAIAGSNADFWSETPVGAILDLGEFLGKLANPKNWTKILAIAGGAGMIVWGGIIVWNAS